MTARPLPWLALVALCVSAAALAAPATGTGSASGAGAGSAWDNLWWTRDQQGQRLLQSDQPAAAAQRFADPRREAYADLRAGRYAQAAKLLSPFRDARSEYNRGNALAHSGRLQDALSAYDAALARSPNDRDTRHNRDLVARALRQSQQQHGQRGDAHQRGGNAQQGGNQGSGAGHGGAQPGSGQRSGAQPQGGGQSPQLARAAQSGRPVGAARSAQNTQTAQAPQTSPNAQPSQNAQTAQAMQSTTARARANHGQSAAPPSNALQALAAARAPEDSASKPESEQTLSLEQWLRRIPDDPGGLLRRKFLIEHQMRQQSADQ